MREPDNDDRLAPRMLRSAIAHVALLGGLAGYSLLRGNVSSMGDPIPNTGGSVLIQPVNSIPIPNPAGRVQPVANDTDSQIPEPPKHKEKPKPKKPPPPEPDAVRLHGKNVPPKKKPERERETNRKPEPEKPNQVYTQGGERAISPIFAPAPGSGGVGLAKSNPFGNRFGYYADLVRQKVAQSWHTAAITQKTAPPAIVTFDVHRDGTIGNVKLAQSSGNGQLDYSCQRAVIEASPLPPLPAGFERDVANIEFWFQLNK